MEYRFEQMRAGTDRTKVARFAHDARKPRDDGAEYVLGRRLARLLLEYLPFQGGDPPLESGRPLTGLVRRSLAVVLLAEQGLARGLRVHQASELALDGAGDVVGMRHDQSQSGLERQFSQRFNW
ncbi:MAG: hypothetical protein ACREJ9_12475 [Candidatus Rokuibacteriota bacterium]